MHPDAGALCGQPPHLAAERVVTAAARAVDEQDRAVALLGGSLCSMLTMGVTPMPALTSTTGQVAQEIRKSPARRRALTMAPGAWSRPYAARSKMPS